MAPTASASGVLNVPPAAVPTTIDFSGAASCVAGFETPTVIASTADGVVFCGLATPRACYALSYATGTFHRFDASHPEPPTTVSSAGRHLLEARRGAIVVCERDAAGTRREPCTTLDVGAFAADAKVPADVSQDGTKVVVVREVGGEAHGFTVDIYDLATRRRLKRFGLKGQEHVSHVRWPGQRIFVSDLAAQLRDAPVSRRAGQVVTFFDRHWQPVQRPDRLSVEARCVGRIGTRTGGGPVLPDHRVERGVEAVDAGKIVLEQLASAEVTTAQQLCQCRGGLEVVGSHRLGLLAW